MALANQQAILLNHEYLGTDHILLGLAKEGHGIAAHVLKSVNVDFDAILKAIEELVQRGPNVVTMSELPLTPRAKQVVDYAIEEARRLSHNYVGTEHLLLGLMREREGVAAQVLLNLGLILDEVSAEVLMILGHTNDGPLRSQASQGSPRTNVRSSVAASLVAVDIGNSRMKIGRVAHGDGKSSALAANTLPVPDATVDLAIDHATGSFDTARLAAWCNEHSRENAAWLVASVHRGAADQLATAVAGWAAQAGVECLIRRLTYRDVPLSIDVDEPARVGIDRLLAALAADQLRDRDRAAIVVDLGTAITVDLLDASGAFLGGAILPGIALSARALEEHTDALPLVAMDHLEKPPTAIGKSTVPAIEAGLYWGAVGAVRELISQMSAGLSAPPDVFLTGGASPHVAKLLAANSPYTVHHVPHLVLSGITLVKQNSSE